jgi:hypothetical protein
MKRLSTFIIFLALAIACVSTAAHAARVGVYVGPAYRYYYPVVPVPYYYPPVVAVPVVPDNYVEQAQPSGRQAQSGGSWYYCDASKAYYPYVKECPGGWREVSAQPTSSN